MLNEEKEEKFLEIEMVIEEELKKKKTMKGGITDIIFLLNI